MYRSIVFVAALTCGLLAAGQAAADNVWLSLNLEFNDPADFGSGGTWTVVAKADDRGIAGVALSFQAATLNFNAATGFLTPAGFEVEESAIFSGLRLETVQGDDVSSKTFDVGVIGGTFPSTYIDDPNLLIFGANPDLGSFSGGVELVTGSFNAGDIPAWFTTGPNQSAANIYLNTVQPPVLADVFLTVRYVGIPEPTSLLLLSGGIMALASLRRR